MSESLVAKKSHALAVRVIKLCRVLRMRHVERELLSQLMRSGTGITANLSEAQYAQSRADFVTKVRIALKESSETHRWIRILHGTGDITDAEFASIGADSEEILKMLTAIIRSTEKREHP